MDIIDSPKSIPKEIGRGTILDRWRLPDGTLYLDNAATRPMLPEVAEEMARLMANNPLNASSQHKYGQKAARMLEDARNFFKSELNVPSTGELIFNSGATEGLNMLLKSAYFADPTKNHIVTVKTEHKAVLNTCAYLETIGAEVTYLDVDEWGQVSISDIEAAIRPTTCAVCVMWVSNETGIVYPITQIGNLCREQDVLCISDITQGMGKEKFSFLKSEVDGVAFSCHKFGGWAGVGVVAMSERMTRLRFENMPQGTQPIFGAISARLSLECFETFDNTDVVERTLDGILGLHESHRVIVPNSSPYILLYWGELQVAQLSDMGVCGSSGSACNEGLDQMAYAYQRLGLEGKSVIRLSL